MRRTSASALQTLSNSRSSTSKPIGSTAHSLISQFISAMCGLPAFGCLLRCCGMGLANRQSTTGMQPDQHADAANSTLYKILRPSNSSILTNTLLITAFGGSSLARSTKQKHFCSTCLPRNSSSRRLICTTRTRHALILHTSSDHEVQIRCHRGRGRFRRFCSSSGLWRVGHALDLGPCHVLCTCVGTDSRTEPVLCHSHIRRLPKFVDRNTDHRHQWHHGDLLPRMRARHLACEHSCRPAYDCLHHCLPITLPDWPCARHIHHH